TTSHRDGGGADDPATAAACCRPCPAAAANQSILVQRTDRRRSSVLWRCVPRARHDRGKGGQPVGTAKRLYFGRRSERRLCRRSALWRRHALYKECRRSARVLARTEHRL